MVMQMWETIVCAFIAGLFAANSVPHFVRGITHERYPCIFGNSSIPNLLAGCASFVIAFGFAYWSNTSQYPLPSFIGSATGILLMGLFHAAGLAFGRKS
jgi:hypothetical protein